MAPLRGRTVCPNPGRCLTIPMGEMLRNIALAAWRYC